MSRFLISLGTFFFLFLSFANESSSTGAWEDIKGGTKKFFRGVKKGVKKGADGVKKGASRVSEKIEKNIEEDEREEAAERSKEKKED